MRTSHSSFWMFISFFESLNMKHVAWYRQYNLQQLSTNSVSFVLGDSQPTLRSASTHLELVGCLSISLFSTPPLLLLLRSLLASSLSTLSPSPLSRHLRSIPDSLLSASACPPLLPPILLSFQPPPLLPPSLLRRPPEHLSSMAVQDLLCRTCLLLLLQRAESQVHSLSLTPGWSPPPREQVCMAPITLKQTQWLQLHLFNYNHVYSVSLLLRESLFCELMCHVSSRKQPIINLLRRRPGDVKMCF